MNNVEIAENDQSCVGEVVRNSLQGLGQEQKGPGATAPKFAVWLLRAVFDGELIAQVLCCVIVFFVNIDVNIKIY